MPAPIIHALVLVWKTNNFICAARWNRSLNGRHAKHQKTKRSYWHTPRQKWSSRASAKSSSQCQNDFHASAWNLHNCSCFGRFLPAFVVPSRQDRGRTWTRSRTWSHEPWSVINWAIRQKKTLSCTMMTVCFWSDGWRWCDFQFGVYTWFFCKFRNKNDNTELIKILIFVCFQIR